MEGVEVKISCQTEDLGNVTPTLGLTRLGLAAQNSAGVETVLNIAIVMDVLTTDMVGYHSTQSVAYRTPCLKLDIDLKIPHLPALGFELLLPKLRHPESFINIY